VYDWFRGQAFFKIEELQGKKFGQWYMRHGFDKSEVSRCLILYKACQGPQYPEKLIGYSARAARREFCRSKRQYKKRTSPPAPNSSEGFVPDYKHDVRRNPSVYLEDLVRRAEAYRAERPGRRIDCVVNNLRAEMENMR
jgi:hypothetical protein